MRTLYAVSIGLSVRDDALKACDLLSTWIDDWYKRRGIVFCAPPLDAAGASSHEPADGHMFRCAVRASSRQPAKSLVEIDWHYPDDYDKGLAWNVQIRMLLSAAGAAITLQLGVVGTQFSIQPASIKLGPPRIVRELTALGSATLGGFPYTSHPQMVRAETLEPIVDALLDVKRPFPIILVSHDLTTERPFVDVDRLAAGLAGLMRVYELADRWAAFRLTDELGKPLSCYAGAVRIYWPGLSLVDDPFKHPAWMPWRLKQLGHTDELVSHLFATGAEATAYRFLEPLDLVELRGEIDEDERQARRNESFSDADKLLEQLIDAEDTLKDVRQQLALSQTENQTLRQNLDALLGAPTAARANLPSGPAEEDQLDDPESVADAVALVRDQTKHLVFLESAVESACESPYRTPSRALQALQAIDEVAGLWVDGLSGGKTPGPLKTLFRQRGFEYKDDISQTSRGKWGTEYEAKYKGQTIDISPHITIGAKQADTCLSVHMHWDKESKKVVIAHVGRHKTNTKT
ncbi:MAG: hypothetical protein IBJ14_11140 [Hydrogenophaga sp.]|nr:hypothetical protein [Hydrogenophaga sp.]